jgi:hypothetical protein
MSLVLKGNDFVPCPEGVHNAVCVDVIDLGMVPGQWGTKRKLRLVWETDAKDENGKNFTVRKQYTASMHEKATLAKDLKSWRGRAFTPEELKGFDVERIVGAPCQLVIVHNEHDGAVYANVQNIMKAGELKLRPSGNYVRVKDRPPEQQQRQQGNGNGGEDDSAIPF